MGKIFTTLFFAMCQFLSIHISAQDGSLDPTFNSTDVGFSYGDGPNNPINSFFIQADGKIIIGGNFTSYNGTSISRVARLNTGGSLDTTFNNVGTGVDDVVQVIKLQSDGKIIIGGAFTTVNGTSRNHIARLNTDGSLDPTFIVGTGANNNVSTISIQSDGKIIIGGNFTNYNGTNRNYLARLNTNGSLDVTFNAGVGVDDYILSTALQSDGKIIIGGAFISVSNYVARLNADGSKDVTFNVGNGANNKVNTIAIQNDGKVIIGGAFSTYNNVASNKMARLNIDGSLDATFNVGSGTNGLVNTVSIQSDGKIIIGGEFTMYNGTALNFIGRLNLDGTLDASFSVGTGTNYYVLNSGMQINGKVIIVGSFKNYNGTTKSFIARLNTNGSLDPSFMVGTGATGNFITSASVMTSPIQSNGKILIGGGFTMFNDSICNYIGRLNPDGSQDFTFKSGTGPNFVVLTMGIQNDGKIIIGGQFTVYNDTATNNITRLNANGSLDSTFKGGTRANNYLLTSAIQSDGKIIIGGAFNSYNGTIRAYVARLNSNGDPDQNFGNTNLNGVVRTIALQTDGKIIVAGDFNTAVVRLNSDGTVDATFNVGTGLNNSVYSTAIQNDGKIIIAGSFTSYNGKPVNRIARLNTNGTLDTTFYLGTGASHNIYTTRIQRDGKIIIGGGFKTFNGIARKCLARLYSNGSLDTTFHVGTGADSSVFSISIQSDDKVIIGGYFTSYNGTGKNRIARLDGSFSPPAFPSLTTSSVSSINYTSSSSGGNIFNDGTASVIAKGVCWSTFSNPMTSNSKTSNGIGKGSFTSSLSGLMPGTTYYVRAYAVNSAGTAYGNEISFTTLPILLATITTTSINSITNTSAASGGNISNNGGATITGKGVCWSTSPNPTIGNSKSNNGTGTGSFGSSITGLSPGTTYYVRAYAINSAGTAYGNELSFTTLPISLASVTTSSISSITETSASSGGNVSNDGGATITDRGVCWGTSPNPAITDNIITNGSGLGSYISSLSGLTYRTIYYVRAYATNSAGTAYGNEVSFTTATPITLASITTASISGITETSASSGGNFINDGGATITAKGVCWSTSSNPIISDNIITNGSGLGSYISSLSGLTSGTTYYVRAYATNSAGTAYGNEVSFTTATSITLASITTGSISGITETSASSGGNVINDGGAAITARGVCWSTSSNPIISDNITTDGSGTGGYTTSLSGLTSGTTYYVRAYATNSVGTAYGNEVSFTTTTPITLASITTASISGITETSASSGGNFINDGGAAITAKGVCWSTSSNPIISDNITTDGSGTGGYTTSLSGLTSGTTYYVRAYATNSAGTAYGSEVSFTTSISTGVNNSLNTNTISIYPNPNTGLFKIELKSFDSPLIGLKIINAQGTIVYKENISQNLGDFTKEVDMKDYSSGIYCVEILTGKGIIIRKIVFQ